MPSSTQLRSACFLLSHHISGIAAALPPLVAAIAANSTLRDCRTPPDDGTASGTDHWSVAESNSRKRSLSVAWKFGWLKYWQQNNRVSMEKKRGMKARKFVVCGRNESYTQGCGISRKRSVKWLLFDN
jgi:hypothetical protein